MFQSAFRRGFRWGLYALALSLAWGVGLGPGSLPAYAEKIDFMMDWTPQGRYVGFYTAVKKGYYRESGLEVTVTRGRGSMNTVIAVDQKKVPFGLAGVGTIILSQAKGAKLKMVGMILDRNVEGFASLGGSGIATVKDMAGRTVGSAVWDAARTLLPVLAKLNGVEPASIKQIAIDGDVYVTSLLQSRVDLVPAWEDSLFAVLQVVGKRQGKKVNWIAYRDNGLDVYNSAIFASSQTTEEKGDFVRRFLRGTYKGVAYALENPKEGVDILMGFHRELDREIVELQWSKTAVALTTEIAKEKGLGWITDAKMTKTRDTLLQAYNIKKELPLKDLYTNQFLSEIKAR